MSQTAKLFTNGRRQAVRLPAAFRFEGKEVLAPLDLLIAAHAATVGAVLVTNDRAFAKVSDLLTEDWSAQ